MGLFDYILLAIATLAGLAAAIGGVMLTLPTANHRAARFAFQCAAVCFGLLGVFWGMSSNSQPMYVRLGVAGVTAAVAAVALTYVLSILKDNYAPPIESPLGTSLDGTVSLECNAASRPTKFRSDRRLYTGTITGANLGSARPNLTWAFFRPGEEDINWGSEDVASTSWVRCDIVNYGLIPVFDVQFEFDVSWQENIKIDHGSRSGSVVSSGKYVSPRFNIGISPNNKEYFYFVNRSANFILVPVPAFAQLRTMRSSELIKASLIPPTGFNQFFLAPWQVTDPSEPPRPVPKPPAPQKEN